MRHMPEGVRSPGVSVAAIALGSNLPSEFGEPAANLEEAVRRLDRVGRVVAVSSFHVTEPVGYTEQPQFTNAAVLVETALGAVELLRELLGIEREMGRDRSAAVQAKGPRMIDLDLLLVGNLVLNTPELTLPHPEIRARRFVLEPLAEIAPDLMHPVAKVTIAELFQQLG